MADLHVLPGVERRDIGQDCPSSQVLTAALENGVTDVVLVGLSRDGKPHVAADSANADAVVGKLMRAVHMLVAHEVAHS